MAIDERSRHEMYGKLEEVLGPEAARTLMEHLPPVGWADVATKRDLDQLELRFDLKLEKIEARLGERLERAIRIQTFRFLALVTAVVGIAVTIASLVSHG
jgi:hypothetical protein